MAIDLAGAIPGVLLTIAGGAYAVKFALQSIADSMNLPADLQLRDHERAAAIAEADARAAEARLAKAKAEADLQQHWEKFGEESEAVNERVFHANADLHDSQFHARVIRTAEQGKTLSERRLHSALSATLSPDIDEAEELLTRAEKVIEERVTPLVGPSTVEIYESRRHANRDDE